MSRVLVVDDKEENLYYLEALLGAHGYEVERARHGAEALVKARRSPPELVISDLLMPVMDGYTLLRHWKGDERLGHIPFVVYTATYTEPGDERLARDLGADGFIVKPCEPDVFLSKITALKTQRGAASGPAREPSADEVGTLREYSETLIRKLEQKMLQLEESNRLLQEDIEARERVELALRESEERFRQLAENIDDVFWLSDLEGEELFYVSPAYERVWARSAESLYASPLAWLDAIHPEDRDRVDASWGARASGEWDETFRIVRPDGSLRHVATRIYPVRRADEETYRLAAVTRDITDVRRLEAQFRQAQKMEAIGRLAGGVAHDFNNLLSVILGYASLIAEELEPSSPYRDDVCEIVHAGERATELTRQLVTFSRQPMLKAQTIDVGAVVTDAERILRRVLGENIELDIQIPESPANVFGERSQVEQIIINLAVNARDAMPEGGRLSIEVGCLEMPSKVASAAAGRYVLLKVRDTGSGMDAATRERIFEPFFTTKGTGKGTGLGLATVFGIVEQSKGWIEVETEVGRGSTFVVYLPLTDRALEPDAPPPPVHPTLRGDETILLVEDDEQVLATSLAILRRHGYHVLTAKNGGEAIVVSEKFEGQIHLLLTDVVMPVMNGGELAERLAPTRDGMKVLFVSGYSEASMLPAGALDGRLAFLQKPTTPDALLRAVRDTLSPASPSAESTP